MTNICSESKTNQSHLQLFDEGHNLVSMNLPKAIENLNKPKLKTDFNVVDDNPPQSSAQIVQKVDDVEYEEDYDNDLFNGIVALSHQAPKEDEEKLSDIRDYSINLWNGSPGLKHWGYDDNDHER